MTQEAQVIQMPIKTKLVCSSCGAPGEGSCRCGAPYVTPGDRAEAAVKANPEKSDRAIAKELGVSPTTVGKARGKQLSSDGQLKRTGRDGKKRSQPKARTVRKTPNDKLDVAANAVANGKTLADAAKDAGLTSVQTVKIAVARDEGRLEVLKELAIDPKTLAPSAKAKLEIAKRLMERKLAAEHATRMLAVDEEVRLRVIAESKDYLAMVKEREVQVLKDEKFWQEVANNHKPLFTADQFKTILMCLHPDGERTAEKLGEAFRLFNNKKVQLTGVKS